MTASGTQKTKTPLFMYVRYDPPLFMYEWVSTLRPQMTLNPMLSKQHWPGYVRTDRVLSIRLGTYKINGYLKYLMRQDLPVPRPQ